MRTYAAGYDLHTVSMMGENQVRYAGSQEWLNMPMTEMLVDYFEDFKDSYLDILKHELLFTDDEIKDFLGGNALRFLGLLPGGKNRQRLKILYQNHKITPPLWFKSLDK